MNNKISSTVSRSISIALLSLVVSVAAAIAQPANDNFANAQVVSGVRVLVSANNIGATKEDGEPNHASNPGGKSVWFQWTAPQSGNFLIGTNRTESNLNTLLHVYAGSSMTALSSRGWNDNVSSPVNMKSVVLLNAKLGTTYIIAVDGASVSGAPAVEGEFALDIRPIHPYQSADYDKDGDADMSLYRPSDSTWYINGSTRTIIKKWGLPGDVPVAMSRSNGLAEPATFRPSEGMFYYNTIFPVYLKWGEEGDIPAPETFGCGVTSLFAVFRPSNGTWYIHVTPDVTFTYKFGLEGDIPVAGNYSPDSCADVAVFRPSNGVWYILRRVNGNPLEDTFQAIQFGQPGDKPIPGDYDGDGLLDPAIYRPSTGTWWMLRSSDNQQHAVKFGVADDIPVTGDFDEDGIFDFAVYRPSEGNWYIRHSGSNWIRIEKWGLPGDIPMTSNLRY